MQAARSLFVDSACVGRSSYRSNRLRHANRRGFLSLLLQCRDKKPSLMRTKQPTDRRNQQAAFLTPLFYLKESQNVSQGLVSWNSADHEQALIDGSRSLLLEIHGKNFPQHLPSRIAGNDVKACEALAFPYPAESSAIGNTQRHNGGTHMGPHNLQADALLRRLDNSQTRCRKSPQLGRRTTTQCTNLKKTVVQVGKCPGLNNTNCVLSYTSIGDPASNRSSCCLNSANCSCCDWLLQPSRRPEASR